MNIDKNHIFEIMKKPLDIDEVLILITGYMNEIRELTNINIELVKNNEKFRFHASTISKYTIYIFPTLDENYSYIVRIIEGSLKKYNTDRYNFIISNVDTSNKLEMFIFALLHEIGHCVHASSEFTTLNEYFTIYNTCFLETMGNCNECVEEKEKNICNYYFEMTADKFAMKYFSVIKNKFGKVSAP